MASNILERLNFVWLRRRSSGLRNYVYVRVCGMCVRGVCVRGVYVRGVGVCDVRAWCARACVVCVCVRARVSVCVCACVVCVCVCRCLFAVRL